MGTIYYITRFHAGWPAARLGLKGHRIEGIVFVTMNLYPGNYNTSYCLKS